MSLDEIFGKFNESTGSILSLETPEATIDETTWSFKEPGLGDLSNDSHFGCIYEYQGSSRYIG
jgi:hypothetical protein